MPRPISAQIDVPSLTHNLAVVASQLRTLSQESQRSSPKIWAVIKANAYGHGIAHAPAAFSQADGLAMLDLAEAVACREAGWTKPILLLEGFFEPADLNTIADYRLSAVVHNREQLKMLSARRPVRPFDVLVKLNTGMNRLGFAPKEYADVFERILDAQRDGYLGCVGKMTHFARADDSVAVTDEQMAIFDHITADLPGPVSVCNSAATLTPERWRGVSPQNEQWVRPGICLYGSSPFAHQSAHDLGLWPAMTLRAELIGVQHVARGAGLGYGHRFVAPHAMRVGVVACGYADGYPRHAPDGTPIMVAGHRSRLVGRVSMDMLLVDLTPAPDAVVGSEVILWGKGGPSVDEVAQLSGTIGYELLCAVAPRVPKTVVLSACHAP